jgi:pimeloyl-ACP methyl ester carboxylesterase
MSRYMSLLNVGVTVNPGEHDARRQFVETDSGVVSYVDAGAGRTALFIHGVGTSGYLWRNVVAVLEGERRCITMDLPLHGRTPARADQDYSLTQLAKVVEDFCAALDLTGVDLVANNTGGAIAQIMAANHPQRFATLALTNCETLGNVPPSAFKPTVWLARAGLLAPLRPRRFTNLRRLRKLFFGVGYQNVEALPEDAVGAYLEPLVGTPQAAREFQRWIASLHNRDLIAVEDKLRRLTVPTLVVWGTGDIFFRVRWAYRLRDTIPSVTEVVEIEGAKLFFRTSAPPTSSPTCAATGLPTRRADRSDDAASP